MTWFKNKIKEKSLIWSNQFPNLSLYLKYLFQSKNSKIGYDLFVYNPRVGKHEAPKTVYNIHRNMPGYKNEER